MSQRDIASTLGVGKTTVANDLNGHKLTATGHKLTEPHEEPEDEADDDDSFQVEAVGDTGAELIAYLNEPPRVAQRPTRGFLNPFFPARSSAPVGQMLVDTGFGLADLWSRIFAGPLVSGWLI